MKVMKVRQQVLNGDKKGLILLKLPNRTFITEEEKTLPGQKPTKHRLTLLTRGNASGDFKVWPLLVYHSDDIRVPRLNNVIKSKLTAMWRSNAKAWVTGQSFIELMHEAFAQ